MMSQTTDKPEKNDGPGRHEGGGGLLGIKIIPAGVPPHVMLSFDFSRLHTEMNLLKKQVLDTGTEIPTEVERLLRSEFDNVRACTRKLCMRQTRLASMEPCTCMNGNMHVLICARPLWGVRQSASACAKSDRKCRMGRVNSGRPLMRITCARTAWQAACISDMECTMMRAC
jgi:hypothetical protein